MTTTEAERLRKQKAYRVGRQLHGNLRIEPAVAQKIVRQVMKEHGLNTRQLSDASGVPRNALKKIREAEGAYVHRDTIRRLRELPHLTNPAMVPVGGTRVRLQCLGALGNSVKDLTEYFGREVTKYRNEQVTWALAQEVIAAMRDIGTRPGPRLMAAKHARAKGYRLPSAYDQDLLFDPRWDGTGGLLDAPARSEDIEEEFLHLVRTGSEPYEAAARVGRSKEWVRQNVAGRHPWVKQRLPQRG